jgi:hypothetical protein
MHFSYVDKFLVSFVKSTIVPHQLFGGISLSVQHDISSCVVWIGLVADVQLTSLYVNVFSMQRNVQIILESEDTIDS